MDSIKGLLFSKVFWFNAITGTLEIANYFAAIIPLGTLMAVNVIGNVALRFVTVEPLAAKVTSVKVGGSD